MARRSATAAARASRRATGSRSRGPNRSTERSVSTERLGQAARARVELDAGEQRRDAALALQGGERVLPVGHHGQVADLAQVHGQALHGRRGVEPNGAAVADQPGELGGNAVLRPDVAAEALGERLGPDGDCTAPDPLHHALLGQHVEVPTDGHLAHGERGSQVAHLDPALALDPGLDLPQPVEGVDAHDASSAGSPARWRRASARSAYTPSATPWTRALPSAVASTGPACTGSRACSASSRAYRPACATPPMTCTSVTPPSSPSTAAVPAAWDSTMPRTTTRG